jgi:hypothetical protein
LHLDYGGAGELQAGINGDVRVGLNEDPLLGEGERNDLVPDGGAILQEERELRAEGCVVDVAQVAESRSFEVETLDVVHREPAAINLFHPVLYDQILEGRVYVTSGVRGEMKLKGVSHLKIFHGLNQPLSLLHQTFVAVLCQ